jgi:hypothetical protein
MKNDTRGSTITVGSIQIAASQVPLFALAASVIFERAQSRHGSSAVECPTLADDPVANLRTRIFSQRYHLSCGHASAVAQLIAERPQ